MIRLKPFSSSTCLPNMSPNVGSFSPRCQISEYPNIRGDRLVHCVSAWKKPWLSEQIVRIWLLFPRLKASPISFHSRLLSPSAVSESRVTNPQLCCPVLVFVSASGPQSLRVAVDWRINAQEPGDAQKGCKAYIHTRYTPSPSSVSTRRSSQGWQSCS